MSYALIEVEAMAKKAARGAGQSWGMAEEAAKAASWLCAQNLDGVAALARALGSDAGQGDALAAAVAISDTAGAWPPEGMRLEVAFVPALLLPFAAYAARQVAQPVTLSWKGGSAVTDGHRLSLENLQPQDLLQSLGPVAIRLGGTLGGPQQHQTRAEPDAEDWQQLADLAQRTYAPASEESRLKGAGAGLNDND